MRNNIIIELLKEKASERRAAIYALNAGDMTSAALHMMKVKTIEIEIQRQNICEFCRRVSESGINSISGAIDSTLRSACAYTKPAANQIQLPPTMPEWMKKEEVMLEPGWDKGV